MTPRTLLGKLATILYAIVGMPLFLLYLSNIGDILAKSFKWIYAKCCLCRGCKKRRKRMLALQRKEQWKVRHLRQTVFLSIIKNKNDVLIALMHLKSNDTWTKVALMIWYARYLRDFFLRNSKSEKIIEFQLIDENLHNYKFFSKNDLPQYWLCLFFSTVDYCNHIDNNKKLSNFS